VQSILTKVLNNNDCYRVKHCKHLYNMIKVLENVYITLTIIHYTTIFCLVVILHMKDTDTMQSHYNVFIQLVQEFSATYRY
jgi:gag-polypeptide of LTR copia-type